MTLFAACLAGWRVTHASRSVSSVADDARTSDGASECRERATWVCMGGNKAVVEQQLWT